MRNSPVKCTGRAQKVRGDLPPEELHQLQTIGKRICELRHEMNITSQDMGRMLNVTKSTYCHMEKGDRRLSIYHLSIICGILGQPLKYFLDADPERIGPRTDSFDFLNADTMELARNFNRIDNIALQATIKLLVQIIVETPQHGY